MSTGRLARYAGPALCHHNLIPFLHRFLLRLLSSHVLSQVSITRLILPKVVSISSLTISFSTTTTSSPKGATWCFCTAAASVLGACCGNDKLSSVTPGPASGRKRSILLMILAIAIAFGFQYGVAPYIVGLTYKNYVTKAWLDGCDNYTTDVLVKRCAGQSGVYRSASGATLFYFLAGITVVCKPSFNREAWPAKYVLFIFLVLAMCFIPNNPLFGKIYLNIARIGGIIFIFFQKIVIIDLAFNWNDSWVGKADAAEAEKTGSGKKWLAAILISALIGFIVSIIGWGLLFHYFGGCSSNTAFIALTVVFCILITAAQLSGEEGSLLSSAVICLYATFLCYNAGENTIDLVVGGLIHSCNLHSNCSPTFASCTVTKNPDAVCNPKYGKNDVLGIVLGIGITIISLGWAGWSFTADEKLSGGQG